MGEACFNKYVKEGVGAQLIGPRAHARGLSCKFGNFRENFIFANSVKSHICDVKNSRLWHDLPISVKDRMISPFREGYIFTKLRICEVSRK